MASGGSGGVSVPALWSEVSRYGQNGDFTRALKTVNKSECQGGCRGGPGPAEGCGLLPARATTSEGTGQEDELPASRERTAGGRVGFGSQPGCTKPALGRGLFRATCTSLLTPREAREGRSETAAASASSKLFSYLTPLFSRLISQIFHIALFFSLSV